MVMILMMLSVLLCSFQCTEHAEPVLPPDENPPVEEKYAPVIIMASDMQSYPLYPSSAEQATMVPFSVMNLASDGRVLAQAEEGVSAEISNMGDGYRLTVIADNNFSGSSVVKIIASNGGADVEETVNFVTARLNVEKASIDATCEYAAYSIAVDSNVEFYVESEADWISVEARDAYIHMTVSENTTGADREAVVVVSDINGILRSELKLIQNREEITIDTERAALIAIYNALGGENWNDSRGWCTDAPLNTWTGVMTKKINGEEHVHYLHIRCQDAVGEIPEEIGNLVYLSELWIIQEPGITGSIPESIRNLKRATDIRIAMTSISGDIPEALSELESLRSLALYDNNLTGNLPLWLARMPKLSSFSFSGNCLDGEVAEEITQAGWWTVLSQNTHEPMGNAQIAIGQKYPHRLWLPGHEDDIPTYSDR